MPKVVRKTMRRRSRYLKTYSLGWVIREQVSLDQELSIFEFWNWSFLEHECGIGPGEDGMAGWFDIHNPNFRCSGERHWSRIFIYIIN